MQTITTNQIKWPEIFSLAALNAAVVISWIAYHEYQPELLTKFEFEDLREFLIIAKAIILVTIPPVAGWLADLMLKKNGKFFTLFTVGIAATAMIFMIVASIIGAGPLSQIKQFLPIMIVFWLISMNLFVSPANSMIESFAPAKQLPLVMGVLVLTTELIYALEPLVVMLVDFFGDVLTFIVGGILVGGTGYLFHRVSSDEVIERRKHTNSSEHTSSVNWTALVAITIIGLSLGVGKAVIVEFLPNFLTVRFPDYADIAPLTSFWLLGFSAVLAFIISRNISLIELQKVIIAGLVILAVGVLIMFFSGSFAVTVISGVIVATAFSLLNISGLPFALQNLSLRHVTYGVGIFIGASEVFTGIFEYYL